TWNCRSLHGPEQCVFLAHSSRKVLLAAGKLHLGLGFSRYAVAHRGTISPEAHSIEDSPVLTGAGAFQDQCTMHPSVGSDDEADTDFCIQVRAIKQRIRR